MSCRPCSTCKGSGFYQPTPKAPHIRCTTCGGSGWIYEKPAPKAYVKRDLSTGELITSEKSKAGTTSTSNNQNTSFLQEYGKTWYKFNIKDTEYCSNGYLFMKSEDLLKQLPTVELIEIDSKKAAKAFFGQMVKDTGFRNIHIIVSNCRTVKGVHYRVNAPVTVPYIPAFAQEGEVQTTVVSGLKLSTQVYIDSRIKQIYDNHRFCYFNPVTYSEETHWYPVLIINNTTGKMDGATMPIGCRL